MSYVEKKGYRRFYDRETKRQWLEHVYLWVKANGPIPEGLHLHHRNGDKLDNRLENLELVDPVTHKRIHGGCVLEDGVWMKPCRRCGTVYPEGEYYRAMAGTKITSWCKPCVRAAANRTYRRRRDPAVKTRNRPTLVDDVLVKPCSKCGTVRPVAEYYKNAKGGIMSWCRPCVLANRSERYRRGRSVT